MRRLGWRLGFLVMGVALLFTACAPLSVAPSPTPTPSGTPSPRPPTGTPTVAPTDTPAPSSTASPPPRMAVSANTNCREGPGTSYESAAVLMAGGKAEVIGRGGEPGYWFVTGETLPEAGCWLWGEFATIEGEVDALPLFTAAPSPTPRRSFELHVKEFQSCGDILYAVFAAKNVSSRRIWSGYVEVEDLGARETLYYAPERHPFADAVMPVCPLPGHGNELWPGETRYIHVPIPHRSGHPAVALVTLCMEDHQQGDCSTEYAYFTIP